MGVDCMWQCLGQHLTRGGYAQTCPILCPCYGSFKLCSYVDHTLYIFGGIVCVYENMIKLWHIDWTIFQSKFGAYVAICGIGYSMGTLWDKLWPYVALYIIWAQYGPSLGISNSGQMLANICPHFTHMLRIIFA